MEPWAVTVTATVMATAVVASMYAPPRRAGLYDAKNDDGLVGLAVRVEAAAGGGEGVVYGRVAVAVASAAATS